MAETVATKELNFSPSAGRQQSVSASAERIEVPPQNGSSFNLQQTIDLRLPSGMAKGHYIDMHNSYVKMTLKVTRGIAGSATADELKLARNGIYNIIQKVEILSSSSTLSVIEDYNKLCNIFLDSESDEIFKKNIGAVQFGMSNDNVNGVTLSGGADSVVNTTFCFPLILTSLYSNTKYLPAFHNDNLVIRLTLADKAGGFVGTATSANVILNPVSMVCQVVKLSNEAQMMVEQMNGNVYQMVLDDWRNAKGVVATGDRSINQNLGFSNQSLSRVIFGFYEAPAITKDTQGVRVHRSVNEYTFQLNGKNYPAQKIKSGFVAGNINQSEVLAEVRASTRQSGDFMSGGSIALANITDGGLGRVFYEIDLEGLRANDQDSIYSGLYTVGGTTSLEVSMNADGANQNTLNVWGQYQGRLVLDLNQGSTFTYSV